jgi:hypothetical protein
MHTYKPKISNLNIIYLRILYRFYHLPVSKNLHFMTYALLILNNPIVSE